MAEADFFFFLEKQMVPLRIKIFLNPQACVASRQREEIIYLMVHSLPVSWKLEARSYKEKEISFWIDCIFHLPDHLEEEE